MGMVKTSFWAVLALLSCPCHLAVILPLLVEHRSVRIGSDTKALPSAFLRFCFSFR
ncbi:hypothetical protein LR69_01581 [Geobacillus sp. BCO2]|nr:hypothetical protein LR69_01581 [Geobacillus sp. BCO2]